MDSGLQEQAGRPALSDLLLESLDRAVIATAADGRVLYWNPAAEKLYGWTAAEAVGRSILDLTPAAQAQGHAEQIMARLRAGERWEGEIMLSRRDGEVFAAHVADSPVLDEAGRLVAIVGVSCDVSERRRSAERQALQVDEYRHRIKNLLSGFQFMADQAFRSDPDPARVHAALTARVKAMALHELATNAVKYGGWTAEGGAVDLAWSCAPAATGSRVELGWAELGGPPAVPPQRRGFGLRLLSDGLPRQLDGSAELDFTSEGVRYRLAFPI